MASGSLPDRIGAVVAHLDRLLQEMDTMGRELQEIQQQSSRKPKGETPAVPALTLGQSVRVIGDPEHPHIAKGLFGIVRELSRDHREWVGVEFPTLDSGHRLHGLLKSPSGWYVHASTIEPC